jgi:hypothetical protein
MKLSIKKLLLLSLTISMLFACKKDEPQPVEKTYRIKQVLHDDINDSYDRKTIFSYSGENLIQTIKYKKDINGNWIENYKREIIYSNNIATEFTYDKVNNDWVVNDKIEYKIENGLMTEEFDFYKDGDTWIETDKYIYQYSNKKLSSWQRIDYELGDWVQDEKGEYIYENDKLIKSNKYDFDAINGWIQKNKTMFSYSGDNINKWILYNYEDPNWIESSKEEYTFTGTQIASSTYYVWKNADWQLSPYDGINYTYNENNYLIQSSGLEGNTTYEYEEGLGNAKLFIYYPEDLVFGSPTIKGKKTHIPYYQRITFGF